MIALNSHWKGNITYQFRLESFDEIKELLPESSCTNKKQEKFSQVQSAEC